MGSILASVRRVGVRAGATFRAVGVLLQTSEAAGEARVAVVVKAAVALTAAVLNLLIKRVRLAAALTPLSARALSEVVSAATGWCREALGLLLAIEPLALGPFAVSLGQDAVACSHIAGLWAGMNAELQASGARAHTFRAQRALARLRRVTHAARHSPVTAAEPSPRQFTQRSPASYLTTSSGHPTGQARDNRCGSAAATTLTDDHGDKRASPTTLRHARSASPWVSDCPVTTDRNRGSPRGRRGGSAGTTRTHSRRSPLATRTPKLPCTPPYLTPTPPALRPPRPPPPQSPAPPPSSARSEEGELESIRSEGTPPSVASSTTLTSIVSQFMRTVSQMEGERTEDSLSEERGVRDQELPAFSSSIEAERQRNRGAQRRGFKQRRGSVQPHMAPRPLHQRPTPTLREQERLSRLVELGLLSFGSLAFEIQRRTAVAQATAATPASTGSARWVTSAKAKYLLTNSTRSCRDPAGEEQRGGHDRRLIDN